MEKTQACLRRGWRAIAIILVVCSLAVIFLFSGQDGATSASISSEVTAFVMTAFTGETPNAASAEFARLHHIVRKLAHAAEYGMLAVSLALLTHTFPIPAWKRYGLPVCACLAAASLDELLQTMRVARNGSIIDVGIALCGAITALLLFAALWRIAARQSALR